MDINDTIRREYEKGTPIKEIALIVNRDKSRVLTRARQMGLVHPARGGGIINPVSSLKGEEPMKPTPAQVEAFRLHCEQNGLPFDLWRAFWHKTKDYSSYFVNSDAIINDQQAIEDFMARLRAESPGVAEVKYKPHRLLVPANFDVHIGKLCEKVRTDRTYSSQEAVRRVMEGQARLYEYAKPLGITDVLLPLGNDIIHVDSNKYTTTNGTPQDADGSTESMMLLAVEMYVKYIEALTENHDVWLTHVSSNHDRLSGWSVSQMIANRLWNNKRVHFKKEVLANTPRKYFIYGRSLIMFQHGDSKVDAVIGSIMAEARVALSQTDFTYCYQGDKHHKMVYEQGAGRKGAKEKDHNGVVMIAKGKNSGNLVHVETVRSPSEADSWHTNNNYINIPAVEAFVHDLNQGQIARFTHNF
jgi:hypothetical protein